jgi:hypothetical protein
MYVTPGIQNLIRENKSFRIDSEIQTGKKYGMQLLDDNLWMHFTDGHISAEEAIDKSKNPGFMVDRMQRAGVMVNKQDDALMAEAEDAAGAAPAGAAAGKPAGGNSDAERQAAITANRARMQAMMGKKTS